MMKNRENPQGGGRERPVSLAPLDLSQAITGLFSIPDPDATKPRPKRKKTPPTPETE